MRKILQILGAITLVVAAVVAGGIGYVAHRGNALDAESKAFVDATIPAISGNWNRHAFLERASPELRQSVSPDQLASVFERFSNLGHLVAYQGSQGQANMSFTSGAGGMVTASYLAKIHCENGDAVVALQLVKRDDRWMIQNLNINPGPLNAVPGHA